NEAKLYFDLAHFIINNHMPFDSIKNFLALIKKINSTYDTRLIDKSHISSTTLTKIIKDCIRLILKEDIFNRIKDLPFSLLLDGATDSYGAKYLGVLVRYINFEDEEIKTHLLSVIELDCSITTGEVLYEKLKEQVLYHPNLKM